MSNPATTPPPESAFLTITRWPDRMDADRIVEALVTVAGVDPYYAQQRLAGGAPAVIQRIDASVARHITDQLRARGVPAIAPTLTQIRALAPPIPAKRLAPALGAPEPMFLCEPWRGEPFGFPAKSIAVMVRARLTMSRKSAPRRERTGMTYNPIVGAVVPRYESVQDSRSSLHDALDIYLRDRRRVRCHGDKFNFDVLGASKGFTDNENMDKLAVMLAESAPRAIVDLGFSDFSCPTLIADLSRTSSNGAVSKDNHPMFDFYSPWIVLVHSALAASERSRG